MFVCVQDKAWCARPVVETSTALVLPERGLSVNLFPGEKDLNELVHHFIWADLILYNKAMELFYDKALLCGIKTLRSPLDA